MVRLDLGNMGLRSDRAFAYFVAFLLVAWDTFRTEEPQGDQLFVVVHLRIVRILGLEEALPCLLHSTRLVEHCMA